MKGTEKSFDTGLRILEVLKFLLNEDISKSDLISKLKHNSSIEHVYTNEAFIKYFNTFELAGLKLQRNKNQYCLENALLYIDLKKDELEIIKTIIKSISSIHNKAIEDNINSSLYRILKYINSPSTKNEIRKLLAEKNSNTITIKNNIIISLNKMLQENLLLQITYRKNNNKEDTIVAELKEIIEKNNCYTIVCYCPTAGRNKKIAVDSIVTLTQLPKKASGTQILNTVVFEVYGRLANLYKLKPSEKVIDFSANHLTISNSEEDKDVLLKRLLKYGENCKIKTPQSLKNDFITMTNEIISNLEKQYE